jgi:hypothetical protein
MRVRAAWLDVAIIIAVMTIFLGGCAIAPYGHAGRSQSELLREAGFTAYTPKSPEKVAYLNTLPARKVVSNKYQGQTHYLVCTDPDSKQCYLGDRAAYQRYQQLAIQESIAEDRRKVAEEHSDPEFWRLWVDSQGGR